MAGDIVDEVDVAKGLSMVLRDRSKPAPYATCPRDDEPLISTLKYRGAEFVCMVCGTKYGFMSPKPAEPTPELEARLAYLDERFEAGDEPGAVQ